MRVGLALIAVLAAGATAPPPAAAVELLSEPALTDVWALGGTVVYERRQEDGGYALYLLAGDRGVRLSAVPRGAVAQDIGVDAGGRVVLSLSRCEDGGCRSWLLDVAADRRRRTPVDVARGCWITAASVWRGELGYAVECARSRRPESGVFVRTAGATRQISRLRGRGFGSTAGWAQVIDVRAGIVAARLPGEPASTWQLASADGGCPIALRTGGEGDSWIHRVGPPVIARQRVQVTVWRDDDSGLDVVHWGFPATRCLAGTLWWLRADTVDLPLDTIATGVAGRRLYLVRERGALPLRYTGTGETTLHRVRLPF